ncbi:putative ribonuclease H protein [Glycine soja]
MPVETPENLKFVFSDNINDLRNIKFNEALLGKWGWELATNQNHFWPRIVMSKYGGWNALIHGRNSTAFSKWWKDLKSIFQQQHTNRLSNNLCWKLGNGAKIRFWKDKWREDDLTLQEKYPTLYQVSYQQDSSISLMGILICPTSMDSLIWKVDPSGAYSTKSAYNILKNDGRSVNDDRAFKIIWNLKIPPRAIAFCWRIFRNRLPTKANLRKRHITLPSYRCPLCDSEEEDIGRIMFSCRMTRNLWWEALRWVNRVGPFPIEPKNHFMQFSHWNRKSFIDNRWDLKSIFQQQHNNCFNDNLKSRVGTGSNISLRNDLWLQDNCNIQRKYPQLYVISKQQNFLINSMGEFVDGRWEWKLSWRRDFFDYEIQMAADFVDEIHSGHIHVICNSTMTRRLWWEPLRWVNRVGPFSTDPKNHFLQFTQWNNKASINNRWKFLWLALSFFVWHHRNAMIFKNQPFDPEKVIDDTLFHTWSLLKCAEKDYTRDYTIHM